MVNFILSILAVNSDPDVSFLSSISTMAGMYIVFSLVHYNKNGSSKSIFTTYLFFIFLYFSFQGQWTEKTKIKS